MSTWCRIALILTAKSLDLDQKQIPVYSTEDFIDPVCKLANTRPTKKLLEDATTDAFKGSVWAALPSL
jgi:hypothetical protein